MLNSIEEINNPRLRSRRPKPHPSSLEEKSDDSDDSIDLVMRKRKRKEDDNFNGEVHERVEEENDGSHEEVDEYDDNNTENERENGKRIVNVVIEHAGSHDQNETSVGNENDRETSDEDLFDTQVQINPKIWKVPPRIHNNINLRNVTDRSDEKVQNKEANWSMKELIEQNRKLNAIIEKQRYDSHDQHLQREREQQQIFEEEERQRQLMELHQRRKLLKRAQREREELEREQQKQEQQERQQQERERREQEQRDQQQRNREQRERERRERERRERGNQIDDEEDDLIDQVYIGRQIFISILAYTEAFREYRPSKFITIMSHAIWGYENLALRAVKVGKRNARKLPLTPAKKLVLEKAIQEIFKTKKFIRRHGDRGAE
ncbi:hypothetical protein KQX54_013174 [Cotesia glomerata]|uniref:Uncharacterized protein n=2 Tax=Cotesia glomerata TaxID=32391 RepID=A0AAV7IHV9_COTGL|nr:hypothetical protein KQX54_013174 [Cotesia glomerata]